MPFVEPTAHAPVVPLARKRLFRSVGHESGRWPRSRPRATATSNVCRNKCRPGHCRIPCARAIGFRDDYCATRRQRLRAHLDCSLCCFSKVVLLQFRERKPVPRLRNQQHGITRSSRIPAAPRGVGGPPRCTRGRALRLGAHPPPTPPHRLQSASAAHRVCARGLGPPRAVAHLT